MTALQQTQPKSEVARPLKVLVPLIKEDLKQGDEAAERAGMPFYRAAGEKMWEACEGSFEGKPSSSSFKDWTKRAFNLSNTQARVYMDLVGKPEARAQLRTNVFSSLRESKRELHPEREHSRGSEASWATDVKGTLSTFDRDVYTKELQNKAKERDLERKLALNLIDIGYKVLAAQLHPDKRGGSSEAMSRLNNVRNRLKSHA